MLVTPDNFGSVMDSFEQHRRLTVDCETTGLKPWKEDVICGVAVKAPSAQQSYYFPFRHQIGPNLSKRHLKLLIKRLSRSDFIFSNWNTKFDQHFLMKEGMTEPSTIEDVMLALHLLNENEPNFKLKDSADRLLGPGSSLAESELKDKMGALGYGKGDLWRMPSSEVEPYACDDTNLTDRLRSKFIQPLKDWGLWGLWGEINEYERATAAMERHGMMLDVPLIHEYSAEAEKMEGPSLKVLERMAGYPCNPNSPKQMQALLGVPSTAKDYLETLPSSPEIVALQEYRGWSKVNSSYYRPYLEKMDTNGVLHPNLNLHGTETGRQSSSDPNMQGVAKKTRVYKVKDVYIARPGHTLVSSDYNQAELRFGAYFAQDKKLMEVLNAGGDVHQATSDKLGLPRDFAKRINFGAFYGLGAAALAKKIHCSLEEAEFFLNVYHSGFTRIRPFYRYMEKMARSQGYIRLWTGRARRFNTSYSEFQKALSNFVQGGVGEVMRHVITSIFRDYVQAGHFQMLLQVHDQILFEVEDSILDWAIEEIRRAMTWLEFPGMPMTVDISVGKSWGNLNKTGKAA